ncbi:hypothetical protein [Oryzomicrobium sp.]|uniref:hypothetical protein n=1 Tax=Oryzomicrobium sp. TaxID=1911578 RepID=UPI0025E683E3|nr:hypothetical protein [Oryzomicrobium sp.]MCE1242554.1 hypothetical protein [Oryzomicrobium sp.]
MGTGSKPGYYAPETAMADGAVILIGMMRALVEVAGMCLLGQGILGLLAGGRRDGNPIYRAFCIVTAPATGTVRRLLPAAFGPRAVAVFTFFVLFALWLGLAYLRLALQRAA